jgi:hypothetical protein
MTRVGFPIDVVVIHRPDHVSVEKRRIDRIGFESRDKRRRFGISAAHRAIMLQQNFGIILLTAAKGAADGIEPK